MKKTICILLCFIFIVLALSSCEKAEENKQETNSESSYKPNTETSEVISEVSDWTLENDWDFLTDAPVHNTNIVLAIIDTPSYNSFYEKSMYNLFKHDTGDTTFLYHTEIRVYKYTDGTISENNALTEEEHVYFEEWLKAGNIPLTRMLSDTDGIIAYHGNLSYEDSQILIEEAKKKGYHIYFAVAEDHSECLSDGETVTHEDCIFTSIDLP